MTECLRCGKCCYAEDGRKCPMLLKIDGLFVCAIYDDRIGFKPSPETVCGPRMTLKRYIPGCPYETKKSL